MRIERQDEKTKQGFSLVEVALAILVAGIGLLSVFSMLPVGLDQNKKAIDETNMALFAEDVMNGVRATANTIPWSQVESMTIKPVAHDLWSNWGNLSIKLVAGNAIGTNVYESVSIQGLSDLAIRYALRVQPVAGNPDLKYARLSIWAGQFGSTTNHVTYYTEIFNTGIL